MTSNKDNISLIMHDKLKFAHNRKGFFILSEVSVIRFE